MSENEALQKAMSSETDIKRRRYWQIVVIATIFICYGFNYFTRNHVYVTTESFKEYLDPNDKHSAQQWLGTMYTFGQIGFFISKLICSFLIDTTIHSGVKPFAFGLIMVPIITSITAFINISNETFRIIFIIILWSLMKGCQAPQWSGVIKIISNWIDYQYYGRVLSFMSLSYLAGDAITRWIFAYILTFNEFNNNWRYIFYFASIMTFIAVIPLLIIVKDSPLQRGLNEPEQNPNNIYCDIITTDKNKISEKDDNVYHSVKDDLDINRNELKLAKKGGTGEHSKSWILFAPLLPQPMFYFILLFNFFLSILRTFFNMYSADYLSTVIGANKSISALISGLFPAMGVLSAPLNGIWIDKMLEKNNDILRYILFPIQGIMFTIPLIILWNDQQINDHINIYWNALLILLSGFGILGCYSMLYVLSLDLGGNKSPTIVSGVTDCVGLIGSISMSFLSGFVNYKFLFAFLSIIAILFVITSICLILYSLRKTPQKVISTHTN